MDINYTSITLVSDNNLLTDMLFNYLYDKNSYHVKIKDFTDNIPDTDAYILISDNLKDIQKIINNLNKKFIMVISHRTDELFYGKLLSNGVSCIYDYSSPLRLFDDIGLHLSIYYNSISDCENIYSIRKDLYRENL